MEQAYPINTGLLKILEAQIGNLVVQLAIAHTRIAELESQITTKDDTSKGE